MYKHDHEIREKKALNRKKQSGEESVLMRLVKSRNSKFFKTLSSVLAAVVVFGTTYSLILPAITIDQESAEEMPGFYAEAESVYGTDEAYSGEDVCEEEYAYDDSQDTEESFEADSYTDNFDQENVYIPSDETDPGDEWAEDDEWSEETDGAEEEYDDASYDDENAAEDETVPETSEGSSGGNSDSVYDENDSFDSISPYTYNETRMEAVIPGEISLLGDVTVRIDYNSSAMIPDGSIFETSEITAYAETEEEASYNECRLENLKETADALITDMDSDWSYHDAAFIDTGLTDPEGNPIQPESDLYLTINFTS